MHIFEHGKSLFQSHKTTVKLIDENIALIRMRFVKCPECLKECGHDEELSICMKDVTRLPARTLTVDIYSQSQGHHTIDRLEARKEEALDDLT